eukprot:tig00000144_g9153.t1
MVFTLPARVRPPHLGSSARRPPGRPTSDPGRAGAAVSDAERASVAAAVAQVAPDAALEEDEEKGQEPRAHDRACELLARAGKLFVAELVRAAQRVVEAKKAQERPEEARHKVMVPMHVWLACMRRDRLDFLTNVGLAYDPDAL